MENVDQDSSILLLDGISIRDALHKYTDVL